MRISTFGDSLQFTALDVCFKLSGCQLRWIETGVLPVTVSNSAIASPYCSATSVLGAILLAGYMGGAICTHWRVGDPFVGQIGIALVIWLAIYLREPRLKALIPLRKS